MAIAKGGKERPYFSDSATREQVIAKLGKPVRTEVFPKPVPLRRAPGMGNGVKDATDEKLVSQRDMFELRGWYKRGMTEADVVAIRSASTLWLLEPFMTVAALGEVARESKEPIPVTVYYSPGGQVVYTKNY